MGEKAPYFDVLRFLIVKKFLIVIMAEAAQYTFTERK